MASNDDALPEVRRYVMAQAELAITSNFLVELKSTRPSPRRKRGRPPKPDTKIVATVANVLIGLGLDEARTAAQKAKDEHANGKITAAKLLGILEKLNATYKVRQEDAVAAAKLKWTPCATVPNRYLREMLNQRKKADIIRPTVAMLRSARSALFRELVKSEGSRRAAIARLKSASIRPPRAVASLKDVRRTITYAVLFIMANDSKNRGIDHASALLVDPYIWKCVGEIKGGWSNTSTPTEGGAIDSQAYAKLVSDREKVLKAFLGLRGNDEPRQE